MIKIESKHVAQILISENLASQVACLHNQCPRGTEWSGLLLYRIEKGGIEDLGNLEIVAEAVFPLDFGDATFTSFEGSPAWFDLFDQFPQVDPTKEKTNWYIGKIHSHHTMGSFHSGTDDTDLYENAPKLPLFLSLVVNYACELDAKIAIATESEQTTITINRWKFKGWTKGFKEKKKEEKKSGPALIIKCEVAYQQEDWFVKQLMSLKPKPKMVVETKPNYVPQQQTIPGTDQSRTSQPGLAYNRMVNNFADLVSLGTNPKAAAFPALEAVDRDLKVAEIDDYKKAFKIYFLDWFDENFYNSSATPITIMNCIENFVTVHKEKWLVPTLKTAINELKTEYYVLR